MARAAFNTAPSPSRWDMRALKGMGSFTVRRITVCIVDMRVSEPPSQVTEMTIIVPPTSNGVGVHWSAYLPLAGGHHTARIGVELEATWVPFESTVIQNRPTYGLLLFNETLIVYIQNLAWKELTPV